MSLAENFQRFSGSLKPRQEALALFLLRNAQMEFQHQRAVAGEMAFKGPNILETMFPAVLFGHARRQLLPFEEIGMHPHRQHFFVMRAIKNADPPAPRSPTDTAEQAEGQRRVRIPAEEVIVRARLVHAEHIGVESAKDLLGP